MPAPASSQAHPDERFFRSLAAVFARAQKMVERLLQSHGLTIAEYALLRVVENTPGMTAAGVRERLDATAPSVAQLVKRTASKGMLKRSRDASDARRQPLELTALGAKRVRAARAEIDAFLADLPLPARLLRSLADDLDTVLNALHSLPH